MNIFYTLNGNFGLLPLCHLTSPPSLLNFNYFRLLWHLSWLPLCVSTGYKNWICKCPRQGLRLLVPRVFKVNADCFQCCLMRSWCFQINETLDNTMENVSTVIVVSKHCRALTTTVRVSQSVHSCKCTHIFMCMCWVFREALVINLITRASSPTQPADADVVGIYGVASRIHIL